MHILGVDLRQQGQVRGMLREFFRTNFLEGVTGKKGSFDVVKFESLGPELRILGGEWMDMVKYKYLYDIFEDRWIDEIKTWTDVTIRAFCRRLAPTVSGQCPAEKHGNSRKVR